MLSEGIYTFTQGIFHSVQAIEYPIYKIFFPNIIPDMLYWIEFRAMRWLSNNSNIFWQMEPAGDMPASLIHKNNHKILVKIQGHEIRIESVDLSGPWSSIDTSLRELITDRSDTGCAPL